MLPILCAAAAAVSTLSAPETATLEQRLTESVGAQEERALALLQRIVDVNSGTMNFDGVREVGRILRPELDALGFETRWVDGAPFGRAGHLVGERWGAGEDPLRVLLIGHLDTVFEPDSPFQRFERLDGDRARGPGITDMKGGNVVMLVVLRALHDAGLLDQLDVTVYLGGDEEDSGIPLEAARADLVAAGRRAEVALGFEDGDGRFDTAVVSRRGATEWKLQVTGQPAHSSLVLQPEVGAGAIYEAARILDAFRGDVAPHVRPATLNPGIVLAGTAVDDGGEGRGTAAGKTNVVAGTAVVHGDLRTYSPEQFEDVRERMRGIVADSLPETSAEIQFKDGYPPMAATEGNQRLLALLDEASRALGHGPVAAVDPTQAGAADISFVAPHVKMAIDGLGLMGTGGHTVEETADLRTLRGQARRVALLLARLTGNPGLVRNP